ncbi:hypothetical protein BDV93DRAFT_404386, partial [Ceratobasidium sp. AG-I]
RTASIFAIQEPYLDYLDSSRAPVGWRPVYPTPHGTKDSPRSRSFLAVHHRLSTNDWEQLPCPSADVTAIKLTTADGPVIVINVY